MNPFEELMNLFNKHDQVAALEGNCYCSNCEIEYRQRQQDAIASFRQQARFSFEHNGQRHCYSSLTKTKLAQKAFNISVPIWDAVNQETIEA